MKHNTLRVILHAIVAAFAMQSAQAVDFVIVYDPNDPQGIDPCTPNMDFKVCPNGAPDTEKMVDIIEAAAAHWSDIIEDDHSILIKAAWFNPAFGSKPEASIEDTDADGRTTVARIRIGPTLKYFYDPTPNDDTEFNMRPALFRTLNPNERFEAFSVQPIMSQWDAVELADIGVSEDSTPDYDADLYTIALHEVGHVIGLSKERDQCTGAQPFYATPPALTDVQFVFDAFKFVNNDGDDDNDCNHLALGGIQACKTFPEQSTLSDDPSTVPGTTVQQCTAHQALMWPALYPRSRSRPSAIDVLAAAAAESWKEIDFKRKFSLSSGLWQDASRWFGPRAPDGNDEAFLANSTTTKIEVNINRSARAATISEGNILEVNGVNLILSRFLRTVTPASEIGPVVVVPPPSDPDDVGIPIIPATLRLSNDAGVQAQDVINFGRIEGNGVVGVTRLFSNQSTVRANGGTLRIATPEGGGVVIEPPVVDLDGPDPFDYTARLIARDGDLDIDAILSGAYRGRVEVGPNRRISFSDGFTQAFSSQPPKRVVIDDGTIEGVLTFAGTVELEGIGVVEGTTTLGSAARVLYEAAGQQPGVDADLLFVEGDIELDGSLILTLEEGFQPTFGLVLSMVQANGQITGAFSNYILPDISGKGVAWNVVQNDQNLLLSVIFDPSEVMSDVNGDGVVNIFDLITIFFSFGPCPPQPAECPADLNGDGTVDFTDLAFWLAAN
ncbi:MAG: hypothetical protein AAF936_18290 [Pseudomonadota bacterium]